jgi:DNA-binding NtrC family response regulator
VTPKEAVMSLSAHQVSDIHTTRVLLVDDDEQVRRMTRLVLSMEGYDVVEADNGRDAMQLFASSPSDVVITDLYMPGEGGRDLIARLHGRTPRVPVILISGGLDPSAPAAETCGADEVLHKPFEADDLTAAIRRVLESAA